MSKILVVDDSKEVLSNIMKILMLNGYSCISAQNGREGFETAKEELPDLIVSDIMMPDYDGYEMLKDLRDEPLTEKIPVIFLSAKVDRIEIRKGMVAGADDYITKPFRSKDLIESIETQLSKKKKLEESLDELYNNISSYIPHELRTPLVSLFGYTELMLTDIDSLDRDEIKNMLFSVRKTTNRLYDTLEKFLKYSETEVMLKDQPNYKELQDSLTSSPEWIIEELIDKTGLSEKIVFENNIRPDEFEVKIFSDHFRTIVNELLNNAIKFSNRLSGIKIAVDKKDDNYCLTITNTGRGMTNKEIANISPFRQHKRDIYEQKGSGLGLAIVKRLCKFYRADFRIESEPGELTLVEIIFPARVSVTQGIAI